MPKEPSRTVTRTRCVVCGGKFTAGRRDARYCSGRCRQRAQRARADQDDLLRQIGEAKRHYWGLVRRYAEALGTTESQVLTGEAQFVDEAGNVYIRDEFAGHTAPAASGGAAWGLEAAGPPWSPPTEWMHSEFGPGRVEKDQRYREALQAIGRKTPGAKPCPDPRPLPDGTTPAPLPERGFTTVIADPPWRYGNTASRGAAENHYPTMAIEELCGLFEAVTARDGLEGQTP